MVTKTCVRDGTRSVTPSRTEFKPSSRHKPNELYIHIYPRENLQQDDDCIHLSLTVEKKKNNTAAYASCPDETLDEGDMVLDL